MSEPAFVCARCEQPLTQPGALLFGAPLSHAGEPYCTVTKRHLCGRCFRAVVGFIRRTAEVLPGTGAEK